MKLNHINKIKANISITSSKKSSNLLDGTYKSVYKGKSMNFENLREYVINDDVKDIDWKASSRSGKLLVKQFVAEKKHNILIVMDSGLKMCADTDKLEKKIELATMLAGSIGYIAVKNGDYISLSYYDKNGKLKVEPFRDNLYKLEEYLCLFEANSYKNDDLLDVNNILKYVYKNITKNMIIFVISDIAGIEKIDTKTLKAVNEIHDILFININDNYMFNDNTYDINEKKYIPSFFRNDKDLEKLEKETRKRLINNNEYRLKQNKVSMVSISSMSEINKKLVELLEEHKYAVNN